MVIGNPQNLNNLYRGYKIMSEKTKEKNRFYDNVVGWACIIWAFVSIALIAIFTGSNQTTFAVMTFGQLFIILGIILLVNKKISGAVSLFAGMSAVVFPAIVEWGGLFNSNIVYDNIFSLSISAFITVTGLIMMLAPVISEDWKKRTCKVQVEAEVVDFKETTLADNQTPAFASVYQYEYEGKLYVKESKKYSSRDIPTVGDKCTLMINPKNPEDVYVPMTKASKMVMYMLGFGMFIAGCGMLMVTLG